MRAEWWGHVGQVGEGAKEPVQGSSQTDSLLVQAVPPAAMVWPGFPGLLSRWGSLSGSLLGAPGDVPVRGEEASWAEGTRILCCTQSQLLNVTLGEWVPGWGRFPGEALGVGYEPQEGVWVAPNPSASRENTPNEHL